MRWNLFFRWFDLWVGAYVDVPNKTLYVCPFPMFGVRIRWGLTLGDVIDEARRKGLMGPDNLCTWCRKPMKGHPLESCIGEEPTHPIGTGGRDG